MSEPSLSVTLPAINEESCQNNQSESQHISSTTYDRRSRPILNHSYFSRQSFTHPSHSLVDRKAEGSTSFERGSNLGLSTPMSEQRLLHILELINSVGRCSISSAFFLILCLGFIRKYTVEVFLDDLPERLLLQIAGNNLAAERIEPPIWRQGVVQSDHFDYIQYHLEGVHPTSRERQFGLRNQQFQKN